MQGIQKKIKIYMIANQKNNEAIIKNLLKIRKYYKSNIKK
jgi:hypothetical protein